MAIVVQLSAREPSDSVLVSRVRSGVQAAEETLYMRHVGRLLSLALRLLGDQDEAEDVVQETFLESFERIDELRDPARFSRFLIEIAVHGAEVLFRERRARRFVRARSLASEHLSYLRARPDLDPASRQQLGTLDLALTKLRDRDRVCWLLHHVDGLSVEEIAHLTHRSSALCSRRIARAERGLRNVEVPEALSRSFDDNRPANARHLLEAFQARSALRGRSSKLARGMRVALLFVCVVALVLFGVRHTRTESGPLLMRDQRNLPSALLTGRNHHAFDLSDGSRITLAAHGEIAVVENSARSLRLTLLRGRVRFDTPTRGKQTLRLESGPVAAEVFPGAEASRFVIERNGSHVSVRVEEGAVSLLGDPASEPPLVLRAGESFVSE